MPSQERAAWLATAKARFRGAEARIRSAGYGALFEQYDADGSGVLDEAEFEEAVSGAGGGGV